MYDKLYAYITTKLTFLTKGQAATIVAHIMYQWVAPHFPMVYNLQLHSTQYQWLTQIYNVIHPLTPKGSINNGDVNAASCIFTSASRIDKQILSLTPQIYLTHQVDKLVLTDYGWGLPLVIDR